MMRNLIFALAAVFVATAPANALTCAALQSAITANANVLLAGDVTCTGTIFVNQNNVRISGPGRLISSALGPAIQISSTNVFLSDFEVIAATENGIDMVSGAGKVTLEGMTVRSNKDSLYLNGGAGLWVRGLHTDGADTPNSMGIRASNWDTIFLSDVLMEQHGSGIRLGWAGDTANVVATNVVIDRSQSVALWIEPNSGSVANVQFANLWGAAGVYPVIIDNSGGSVTAVQIVNGRFSDFTNNSIGINGVPAGQIQTTNIGFF